jgi:hypothetical protein
MHQSLRDLFLNLIDKIVAYLPNLLAGFVLIGVGWFFGWLAKRIVIQLAIILKLQHILIRFNWGEDFSKADIRHGFYNILGDIAFLAVFLVFLNAALSAWQLTILSNLLEKGILLIPKIIIALFIFITGVVIASLVAKAMLVTLTRENIPRPSLIARFAKAIIIITFSAMALIELDIAKQVILIGFATIFITLGILTVVIVTKFSDDISDKLKNSHKDD